MSEQRVYGGQAVVDRARERRDRFTAAATELFGTVGYTDTTVTRICRLAGLSSRQFYQEFSDREDLLRALYDSIQDRLIHAVATAMFARVDAGDDLDEVLDAGVRAFVGTFDDPHEIHVVFVEVVGVSQAFEEHRAQRRERWSEMLTGAIAAGVDSGRWSQTATPLQWAAYIGAVNAAVVERARHPEITADDIVLTIRTLLRPGILG